ncbi:MAG: N(4)-(beta-N-acetylglucosaminyl)-L-asparaginase [Acidobacteria bacterium]|nr:N(4)-(beta-N-acetylglucosaminyl)-L-asparaginase [Acidobacteriota bacterium]
MRNNGIKRRDFLKHTAAAGLSAPLLTNESLAVSSSRQATRPVVISSANVARTPTGETFNGGIACVNKAMEIVKMGGDTLEAVVAGVNIVEEDPRDNSVGYGGLPNEEGDVELDASVMHGPTRRAGAVASLRYIKTPSKVAKLVLERTDHILLVGEGALRFALKQGFKREELLTEASRMAWLAWRENLNPNDAWGPSPLKTARSATGKISQVKPSPEEIALNEWIKDKLLNRPTGTINCLAVDANGDISGVTTTSGLAWKIPGRVGDSPLIGCGLYVDNDIGAAGSTGRGEECIYINGAHTVVENMRRGMSPTDAAMDAIKRIAARYGNNLEELRKFNINFYAVNKRGEYGGAVLWKGGRFVVHDGKEAKIVESVFLFERK